MTRWKWGKLAVHMGDKEKLDEGVKDSLCWVTARRGLTITLDPKRVTCKFCQKILEDENEKD